LTGKDLADYPDELKRKSVCPLVGSWLLWLLARINRAALSVEQFCYLIPLRSSFWFSSDSSATIWGKTYETTSIAPVRGSNE
jgi:hypothetical protein